jgi:hypothetical protein
MSIDSTAAETNPFQAGQFSVAPSTYLEDVRTRSCYSVLRGMIFLFFLLVYALHALFIVAFFTALFDSAFSYEANGIAIVWVPAGTLLSLFLSIATHQACRIGIDIADLFIHSGAREAGR